LEIEGRRQSQILLKPMMPQKVGFVQMIVMGLARAAVKRRRRRNGVKILDDNLAFLGIQ
jgi:hypothetical protein